MLVRRGGHLRDPRKKKVKGFEALRRRIDDELEGGGGGKGGEGGGESGSSEDERRRAFMRRHPGAYKRDEDGGVSVSVSRSRS